MNISSQLHVVLGATGGVGQSIAQTLPTKDEGPRSTANASER